MSLEKEMVSVNGASANYHRVEEIVKNGTEVKVKVQSYADKSYREKELNYIELVKKADEMYLRLSILTGKPEGDLTEEEKTEVTEIQEKLEYINGISMRMVQFTLFSTEITLFFEESEEISFPSIYEKLKGNGIFVDSTDC